MMRFDKVYKDANGNWSIVECKGGASELGSRAGNQQCTKAYIDSIIENLKDKLDGQKLDDLLELESALNRGKTKNYLLNQPFNVDGSLGTTKLTEYDL